MTPNPISASGAALASAIDTLKKAFDQVEAAQCGEAQLLSIGKTTTRTLGTNGIKTESSTFNAACYRALPQDENMRQLGTWWGIEERLDNAGRWWMRCVSKLVVNDFGDLVEVAA